jgi:hypothetical protein
MEHDSQFVTSLGQLLAQQLQPLRDDIAKLHVDVGELKVAGARRNGCADSTSKELARLSDLIEKLPCSVHAQQMAELNLKVALLEREDQVHDDKDQRQEKQLDTAKADIKEVAKYVVTSIVSLVIGYLFFRITGIAP